MEKSNIKKNSLYNTCPKGHSLIFTSESKGTGTYSYGEYNCDICKTCHLSVVEGRYACVSCEYDVCQKCRPKELPNLIGNSLMRCNNNHPLLFTTESKGTGTYSYGEYNCDICKTWHLSVAEGRYACVPCEYDVCQKCRPKELPNLIGNSLMRCNNNHSLLFTTDSKGTGTYSYGEYNCDICKTRHLSVAEGRYACVPCEYDVCQKCRPEELNFRRIIELKKCKQNHNLVFTTDRSNKYQKGLYCCACCKNDGLSVDAGRYACVGCSFDICWNCIKPEPYLVKLLSLCPKNHKLIFDSQPNNISFFCNMCGCALNPSNRGWLCKTCNFNICINCKPADIDKNILTDSISIPEKTENEKEQCILCCKYKINTVIVPCGHVCVCSECGNKLPKKVCPMCNTNIQLILKTFHA